MKREGGTLSIFCALLHTCLFIYVIQSVKILSKLIIFRLYFITPFYMGQMYIVLLINQCENYAFIDRFPHIIKKIPSIRQLIVVAFDWTLAVYQCLIGLYTLLFFCSSQVFNQFAYWFAEVHFSCPISCLLLSPIIETLSCVKHRR